MRYILVSILFFLAFAVCNAQNAPQKKSSRKTPEQKAENKANKLSQQLSLTPDQTKQLNMLYLQCDLQLDSLRKQEKALRTKKEDGLKQILTPEQYKAYQDTKTSGRKPGANVPAASPAVAPAGKQ